MSDQVKNGVEELKPTGESFSSKWRQLKACARCHKLKLRCSYDDPTYASCRRCFAAGVECSVIKDPPLGLVKKRPKTKNKTEKDHLTSLQNNLKELFETYIKDPSDSHVDKKLKVDNVEKIYDIQNQLSELQTFLSHVLETSSAQTVLSSSSSSINSIKDGPVKLVPRYPSIPFQYNIMQELLKLNLIEKQDCLRRFRFFIDNMLSYWPNVSFSPQYMDFEFLLENRPLVLLLCVAVTALNEPNLHDLLLYYLERNLAQRVCITGDLSVDLIYVYTILSLWSSPPKKWGSFKHQMNLLMSLNLSLCLESPNEKFRSSQNVLYANSEERKLIRCHITVYSCCGSLGLSLPKFKIVSWNSTIASCCDILLMGETSRLDRFLSYYARIIGLGQNISDYFTSEEKIKQLQLGDKIKYYETRLQNYLEESELFTMDSKERYLLNIIYYQLLMTMHDYIVCGVVEGHSTVIGEVYLSSLSKLIRAAEKVVDSFVNLCEETMNFPTFFYYRPMHALVALIRARLLVVIEKLDVDINVQREYDRVKECLMTIWPKSLVAKKMSIILTRVEKWMKISVSFNKDGATNSMETLLGELGDEKSGVENLKAPSIPQFEETNDEKPLQDFFKEIDQDLLNIQFMTNQKNTDESNLTDDVLRFEDFINSDALEEFINSTDSKDFFHGLEATGNISRNNSIE